MRSFWLCILCIGALPAALRAQPLTESPPAPEISDDYRRAIEQLDAHEYAVRQQAETWFFEQGGAAILPLEAAAKNGTTGVLTPALRVLERMLIEGCPDLADRAEHVLERLAFADRPDVRGRARVVLSGNQHLRQRRALAAIRELGGRVVFKPLDGTQPGNVLFFGGGNPPFEIVGISRVQIMIFLLRAWEGGEEGLWHLTRLEDAWSARLWGMEVTSVRGSGVPIEAVQALAARIPQLQVQERGGSLGITGGVGEKCQVNSVLPGGAADMAGLQEQDVVLQLNGTPVESFSDLVGKLLDYEPKDTVTLRVDRGGNEFDLPVELGDWSDLTINAPNRVPAPLLPPFNRR